MSFASITFCIASQRVIPKVRMYFVIDSVRELLDTPSYEVRSNLGSSVNIAIHPRAGRLGFDSLQGQVLNPFATASRSALG